MVSNDERCPDIGTLQKKKRKRNKPDINLNDSLVTVASQSYHFRQLRSIFFFIPPAFLSFASFRHIFLSHSCIFRVYFVLYLLCSGHSCYYPLQFVLLSSDISMTFLSQSSVFVFHSSCVRAKYIRGFLLRMRDEFYFVSIRIPFV